eukprot:164193-Chlamydomonas_euryale.AAC.1
MGGRGCDREGVGLGKGGRVMWQGKQGVNRLCGVKNVEGRGAHHGLWALATKGTSSCAPTLCPASQSLCPASQSPCPASQSPCPASQSLCPATQSLCPASQSPCPASQSLCP